MLENPNRLMEKAQLQNLQISQRLGHSINAKFTKCYTFGISINFIRKLKISNSL